MAPLKLNDVDRRILRQLQRDCSVSSREAAAALGMSQSTYWRRASELEAAGAVTARVAVLDAEAVGAPVSAVVNVRMSGHAIEIREAFESFVRATAEIAACFSVTGEHDYTLIVRTPSVTAFEEFLMTRILAHPSVLTASSQIALRQLKYTTALPL
ncbi:MAG: Lrp/AsnC family transcriptional regulator [Caulobacterales bacterium]|nr:Lrp/AsnC family transcriptional regulator [Caulobacterales bacterium]